MHIFVQMWREFDPLLNISVSREDNSPKSAPEDQLYKVSQIALKGLKTALLQPNSEVTAFCFGQRHAEALHYALALGVRRAVLFKTDKQDFPDFRTDSKALFDWLHKQKYFPDVIIGSRVCGVLSARLNYSFLSGLESFNLADSEISGVRLTGKGARELVAAPLPSGISLGPTSESPPYISQDRLNQINKNSVLVETLEGKTNLEAENEDTEGTRWGAWQPFRPRIRSSSKTGSGSESVGTRPKSGLNRFEALMGAGHKSSKPTVKPVVPVSSEEPSISDQTEKLLRYLIHHNLIETQEKPPYE